jgi:hypothetical protein
VPVPLEYLALRDKVDAFADRVLAEQREHLQCRAGCAGCCQADLSVSGVEAAAIREHLLTLPAAVRTRLQRRAAVAPSPASEPSRCVMLDGKDRCQIYAARPLVCRTQGLPLRYPAELIPVSAVRLRTQSSAVTVCPLNFQTEDPPAGAILDAERVDQLLALINQRHAAADGASPLYRAPLRELLTELPASAAPMR